MTRLPATTATSKPSSCSRKRSGLRLISCCDMERHPLDHVNRLARKQRALRARRRAFAVADGEADLRSRRRLRERQGDEFLETDGAGADNILADVHQDMDRPTPRQHPFNPPPPPPVLPHPTR